MADIIAVSDLPTALQTHESVELMVDGANAKASRVAPCLASTEPEPSPGQVAEAKLVLVGAIKRWVDAGTGALQSQQTGPFGVTLDTRQKPTGYNLWPSEIESLQEICANESEAKAFSVDTAPSLGGVHVPWCASCMGANFCSCGVDIAGEPIYEL